MRNVGLAVVVVAALCSNALAVPCEGVSEAGCCTATSAKFCENGQLKVIDCTKNGPADEKVCGWWPEYGYYDCGGVGKDPSGKHPYLCPGATCTPSCAGKECGSDGCDGTCGTCTGGKKCGPDFKCQDLPDCNGVPFAGCCDGNFSKWCEKGYLHQSDCTDRPPCGWKGNPGDGVYDCGFTGPDPSGKYPQDCSYYFGTPEPQPDAAKPDSGADVAQGGPDGAVSDPTDLAKADQVVATDQPAVGQDLLGTGGGSSGAGGSSGGGCTAGASTPYLVWLLPLLALRRRHR